MESARVNIMAKLNEIIVNQEKKQYVRKQLN
jgi:hypothetical protein